MRRHSPYLTLSLALCLVAFSPNIATAAPPTITNTHVSDPTTTSITLHAEINPQGKEAKYRFEYGPEDCAISACTKAPVPEASISPGSSAAPVSIALEGLSPGIAYHYRVVAKNGTTGSDRTEGPDLLFATYALPPSFGPCPNEIFRKGEFSPPGSPSANLPDCRAYEQASPIDKNGGDARGFLNLTRAAIDGGAATFVTTSGIPGGEGAQEPPVYLASRTQGSWSTQGLSPPASLGPEGWPLGWSPDFSQVFAFADSDPGALADLTFLARNTADSSLTSIVPFGSDLEQVELAGTSPDGSIALIESFGGISAITGTQPGKRSLYLWQRASGAISLAGVLNDGDPLATDIRLGTQGGEGYSRDNNAIATDGSYVFTATDLGATSTTKGSGEIYLRQNPTSPQSALDGEGNCAEADKACTFEVSATEKENGQGKDGSDGAGHRPATFMTATPDGSKVFFTSPEKLTNDATTGPEPSNQAAIASANLADGKGVDLEFFPAHAKGIAISGSHIYWADPSTNSIGRAKLEAGEPKEVEASFITGANNPQYVAIDPSAEHVYWTNAPKEEELGELLGTIGRAKLDVGDPKVDQEYITGASNPQGIAVSSEFIYWANNPPAGMKGNYEAIDKTRTIGRAKPEAVKGEEVNQGFIAVGSGAQEHTPQGIAINTTHIYMAIDQTQEYSNVFRFDLDGQNRLILGESKHTGKPGLRGIAIDASHVYWAREGEDSIGRVDLELKESSAEREWIKAAGNPRGLALDASHLYWSANQEAQPNPGNDLYRYDLQAPAGKRLTDIAPDTSDPNGVEVEGVLGASEDGDYVYYAAAGVPDGPIAGSPNQNGEEAEPLDCDGSVKNSRCNLYLSHEGGTTFIAQLSGFNEVGNDPGNWSTQPSGSADPRPKTSRISGDGHVLLFSSKRQLTAYDNSFYDEDGKPTGKRATELYHYDADKEEILCVSCSPTGVPPTGGPGFPEIGFAGIGMAQTIPVSPASTLSRNLSADGNRVFFETEDALVGTDTNGEGGCPVYVSPGGSSEPTCLDVYEWEAAGTGSCQSEAQNGGCLYLLSTGNTPSASFIADASTTGDEVFIFTRNPLVRQDEDQLMDLYALSEGGGLSSQNQPPAPICEGEACKEGLKGQPQAQSPITSSFQGPENPTPSHKPRCKKKSKRQARRHKSSCAGKKRNRAHQGAKRAGRTQR